jgi:hypothetical protein
MTTKVVVIASRRRSNPVKLKSALRRFLLFAMFFLSTGDFNGNKNS